MTPKEKAELLIEDFTFNCKECDNAKIAALRAVYNMIDVSNDANIDFLEKVKQEIEKL